MLEPRQIILDPMLILDFFLELHPFQRGIDSPSDAFVVEPVWFHHAT